MFERNFRYDVEHIALAQAADALARIADALSQAMEGRTIDPESRERLKDLRRKLRRRIPKRGATTGA